MAGALRWAIEVLEGLIIRARHSAFGVRCLNSESDSLILAGLQSAHGNITASAISGHFSGRRSFGGYTQRLSQRRPVGRSACIRHSSLITSLWRKSKRTIGHLNCSHNKRPFLSSTLRPIRLALRVPSEAL